MNQYQSNQPIYVSISTNEHKDNLIALAAGFLFGFIVQFPPKCQNDCFFKSFINSILSIFLHPKLSRCFVYI